MTIEKIKEQFEIDSQEYRDTWGTAHTLHFERGWKRCRDHKFKLAIPDQDDEVKHGEKNIARLIERIKTLTEENAKLNKSQIAQASHHGEIYGQALDEIASLKSAGIACDAIHEAEIENLTALLRECESELEKHCICKIKWDTEPCHPCEMLTKLRAANLHDTMGDKKD